MQSSSPFLTNKEAAEAVVQLGIKKANHPYRKTFLLGAMAGLFVAMGYLAALIALGEATPLNPALAKFLGALAFSMALSMIVLVGGDLLTGNALVGLAFFNKKVKFMPMLNNWIAVWFGNLAGTSIIALFLYLSAVTMGNDVVNEYIIHTAEKKLALPFLPTVISGFFCNAIIATAVWASMTGKDVAGKLIIIFLSVYAFLMTGYQHSVANMFIFSYAQLLGAGLSWSTIFSELFAATIGNLLSAGIVMPFLYNYILLKDNPKSQAE